MQVDQVESLGLTKTASPSGTVAVGDVITYTMTATNDGTVTIDNVSSPTRCRVSRPSTARRPRARPWPPVPP